MQGRARKNNGFGALRLWIFIQTSKELESSNLQQSHAVGWRGLTKINILVAHEIFWFFFFFCFFKVYFIDYVITVAPFFFLLFITLGLNPASLLSSCLWVIHISSLASPFPILFLTSSCLFSTYHLCFLFSVPFPLSPPPSSC